MATVKRSESPLPVVSPAPSRRPSFMNLSAQENHQILPFPQFPYQHTLHSFSLPGLADQSNNDTGPSTIYSHHPSPASYHLHPSVHSGFSSPASNHSSPNPYSDFNPFPISPPSTGTTVSSSIINHQHPSQSSSSSSSSSSSASSACLIHHAAPNHNLSHVDLSSPSTLASTNSYDLPRCNQLSQLPFHHPHQRHHRRDSYSTTLADPSYPSYERRNSSVSVGSRRSIHSTSPYNSYASLDTHHPSSNQSQLYSFTGDLSNQAVFYIDSNTRHTVPPPSGFNTSNNFQPTTIITDVPRLAQSPLQHVPPSSAPPSTKLATRQYRKKTPPEACAVCWIRSTPEWRKGPSGLRTLCNACGLTAAKQSVPEPTCVEEVWAQLLEIGLNRFKGNYNLDEKKKAAAAQNWTSQTQARGRMTNPTDHRGPYSSMGSVSPTSTTTATDHSDNPTSLRSDQAQAFTKMMTTTTNSSITKQPPENHPNPAEIDAAQQLFSMSRGRMPPAGNQPAGISSPNGLSHNNMLAYSVNSSPHTASLSIRPMDSNQEISNGDLNLNPTEPLQTTTCDPTERSMLKALYPHPNRAESTMATAATTNGTIIPARRRRDDSMGGHRMSISSIINQDSPKRVTSTPISFDPHDLPQVQAFHQELDHRHHHHQHVHQPPAHSPCHQHLHHHHPFLFQPASQTGYSK